MHGKRLQWIGIVIWLAGLVCFGHPEDEVSRAVLSANAAGTEFRIAGTLSAAMALMPTEVAGIADRDLLGRSLGRGLGYLFELRYDGVEQEPVVKTIDVRFPRRGNRDERVPVPGWQFELELLYPGVAGVKEISGRWAGFDPNGKNEARIELIGMGMLGETVDLTRDRAEFTWQPAVPDISLPPVVMVAEPARVNAWERCRWPAAGILFGCVLWVLLPWRVMAVVAAVLCFGAGGVMGVRATQEQILVARLPAMTKVRPAMVSMLTQAYLLVNQADRDACWNGLTAVAMPGLREQLYMDGHLAAAGTDPIRYVNKVEISEIREKNRDQVVCRWQVEGYLWHAGHLHPRQLVFESLATLAPAADGWRLAALATRRMEAIP